MPNAERPDTTPEEPPVTPTAEKTIFTQPGEWVVYRAPGFIAHACPSYHLTWGGRTYWFEWHPYCGPSLLKNNGDPYERQPGVRHPFWDAIEAWTKAGRRVDEAGNCIMGAADGQ